MIVLLLRDARAAGKDPDTGIPRHIVALIVDGIRGVIGIDDPHNIGPWHAKKTRRGRSPHIAFSSNITNGIFVTLNSTCGTCSWNETDILVADAEAVSIERVEV